jgi:hypothetical protein
MFDEITIAQLWGILPTAIAVYYFIKNQRTSTKQEAKDEDKVDIGQDKKIAEVNARVDLLELKHLNLEEKMAENKTLYGVEFTKIGTELSEIRGLIMKVLAK